MILKLNLLIPLQKVELQSIPVDRETLFSQLTPSAFSGGKISKLSGERPKSFFIKNLDTKVSVDEIKVKLVSLGITAVEIKRIQNLQTSRPTKTVKVSCLSSRRR